MTKEFLTECCFLKQNKRIKKPWTDNIKTYKDSWAYLLLVVETLVLLYGPRADLLSIDNCDAPLCAKEWTETKGNNNSRSYEWFSALPVNTMTVSSIYVKSSVEDEALNIQQRFRGLEQKMLHGCGLVRAAWRSDRLRERRDRFKHLEQRQQRTKRQFFSREHFFSKR